MIFVGAAVLWIAMGNFMSKLRPNYFIGIRTPWALKSKEVWIQTHRVGGPLMIAAGFFMLIFCFLVPVEKYVFWVMLPIAGVMGVFSILYSFLVYRKLGKRDRAVIY